MRNFSLILCTSLLLTACGGEFSYKRGATPADLEKTKAMCKAQTSEAQINKCLEDNGWAVQKLDDMDLFPMSAKFENMHDIETGTTPAAANKTSTAASPVAPVTANSSKVSPSAPTTASQPANSATPPPAAPANPLDTYVISSWWKLGVMGDALQTDTDACVATLGEAHSPNSKTQTATRGFIVCMRGKGWSALRAVK
jgi:hypothetical protein